MMEIDPTYEPKNDPELVTLSAGRRITAITFLLMLCMLGVGLIIGFLIGEATERNTTAQNADDFILYQSMKSYDTSMRRIADQTDALIKLAEKGCLHVQE